MPEHTLGEGVASEFNKDISSTPLAALYAFVDEQIALLRLVSFYFISASTNGEKNGILFYKLTIRQLKILASIRLQCTYGLDTNARMQLRLLYENSILWARLRVDNQALEDFNLAITSELSNNFWHKYISKSKTEKFLNEEFNKSGHSWIAGANNMIEELKKKVGLASHPSLLAAYFDASYDFENFENGNIALSEPGIASHLTLSFAILAASIPFSIKPELSYGLSSSNIFEAHPVSPLIHSSANWNEYNEKIRDMLPTLLFMSVRFSEGLRDRIRDKKT
jgi:hypothetical protein